MYNLQGDLPPPRKGHAAAIYKKAMYIYGGNGEDNDEMNWIYQLTLGIRLSLLAVIPNLVDTWVWKKIDGIARPSSARYFASSLQYGEGTLFV